MRCRFLILYFLVVTHTIFAESINDSVCRTKAYAKSIRTIQVGKAGFELGLPMLELGSGEQLTLSFDDLDAAVKQYKYTFIHCDADWTISDIQPTDYMQGLREEYIPLYKNSFNTAQAYVHYSVSFPTPEMNIIESGNYLIRIFDDEHPDITVLTARFSITEKQVGIEAQLKKSNIIQDMFSKQEIDFSIDLGVYKVSNPYRELQVVIQQNGRLDNKITTLKPRMLVDTKLLYDYDNGDNTIEGGHEFRNFDIKSIKYQSERIRTVEVDSFKKMHVYLLPDQSRQFKQYSNMRDINGRYLIKADGNISESAIEADYIYVHFSLPFKAPEANASVFLLGAFTGWEYTDESIMTYNYQKFAYEKTMYLKQGYYNYQYVVLGKGEEKADIARVEGTHSDTENEYLIYVYHRPPGVLYDKLIGVKAINTLVN